MLLKDLGEFSFIDKINKNTIFNNDIKIGIGDDCAVYTTQDHFDQLITTDTMVENVHFSFDLMSAEDIGYRLCAANFSDIAAMGGNPKHLVLAVAAYKDMPVNVLCNIYEGVKLLAEKYKVNIIGGDTTSTSGPLILTMTVIGEVIKDRFIARSTAQEGDLIGVTNTLGSSLVGLEVLSLGIDNYNFSKQVYRRPEPQIKMGKFLAEHGASSLNDISDGLASELNEIAVASHCELLVYKDKIPLHTETFMWSDKNKKSPYDYALFGGEDYQLLFTISKENYKKISQQKDISIIGEVLKAKVDKPKVYLKENENIISLAKKGYEHFK